MSVSHQILGHVANKSQPQRRLVVCSKPVKNIICVRMRAQVFASAIEDIIKCIWLFRLRCDNLFHSMLKYSRKRERS